MGLFDGTGPDGEAGSTAALARLTGWPVVLIVDVRGQGASVAALLRGFRDHDREVALAGVIFNRVGSARHRALLEDAVARHLPGMRRLGAIPADPGLDLPSRHLGLVPAGETDRLEPVLEQAAERVAAALDITALIGLGRRTGLRGEQTPPGVAPLGQRIAVARDDAFLFTYAAQLDSWRRCGAELSFFSPLADEPPDPAADAVYLPGGYPELHAGRLAAASTWRAALRRAAAGGVAIYGECGGYMVLGEGLIDGAGMRHAMAGLLPVVTSFAERRLHLGYRRVRLLADGPLGAAGTAFRGHEFHYARVLGDEGPDPLFRLWDATERDLGLVGARLGPVCGSFIHRIDREEA
jgi:cobyrinic acid a,c-diamide synthase